ncbi:MAG: DUF4158 domain-containing protein [Acidobacteria bacterium]|nr:DUF4158 domain-containing protein [Acidobacteriota bacterium]
MSRQTLLSAEQRTRLFGIPTKASEIAKYYVLSSADLALIRTKRRSGNQLGFAVQLCLLRYPGQGLGFGEHPPETMIAFVARQLDVSPTAFSGYALRAKRDGSMPSNCRSCLVCAASAWRTGAPACRPAPTPPGRVIAASRSCRPCSRTCGASAYSSRPRRCWSELGSPHACALVSGCSRLWPKG